MAVQISGNDITVPRDGSFTRNVTIGGTLTYEDVTNIDSVGLVTARSGIEIGARPGVAASISVDGNMIVSGISTFQGLGDFNNGINVLSDVTISDSIVHEGDDNTKIRFPSADTITAETGGTERFRITSDGKYQFPGTGGGSGSRGLEIDTESVGAADEGVILNARASGTTGRIKLQTNSTTAVTIDGTGSNGNVTINTGNLVIGTSGKGIDFSATSDNAGATSEILDDYEEGIWTPGLAFGATDTGMSYSSRSGSYVKIGRFVYCQGQLDLSSKGSSTGDATFTGLPFTVGDYLTGTSQEGSGFITWWANMGSGSIPTTFWISQGGTSATIYRAREDSHGAIQTQTNSHWNNNSQVRFLLQYMAA